MLPLGQRYEQYIYGLAPRIFDLLGFEDEPDSIVLRGRIVGHTQRHEFDIVAEYADGRLVLVECKNHRELKAKEAVDFYFSVADVRFAHPQVDIHGVLVSSTSLSASATNTLFNAPDLYLEGARVPITALKILELGTRSPTIAYEYRPGADVRIEVIPLPEPRGLDELLVDYDSPQLEARLAAALGVISNGTTSLQCHAHIEAATQLLHFGLSDDAIAFSQLGARKAGDQANRHLHEASMNLEAMARFQRSASVRGRRRSPRPAERTLRVLRREADTFLPEHRSSALSFLGAWVGRYVGKDDAIPLLNKARTVANGMDDAAGAYLAFVADFRMAELAQGGQRQEMWSLASSQVGDLGPRHAELASTILSRAEVGEDTSIEANYFAR